MVSLNSESSNIVDIASMTDEELWIVESVSFNSQVKDIVGVLEEGSNIFPTLLFSCSSKHSKENQVSLDFSFLTNLSSQSVEILKEKNYEPQSFLSVSLKSKEGGSNNTKEQKMEFSSPELFKSISNFYSSISTCFFHWSKISGGDRILIGTLFGQLLCFEGNQLIWCFKLESIPNKILLCHFASEEILIIQQGNKWSLFSPELKEIVKGFFSQFSYPSFLILWD